MSVQTVPVDRMGSHLVSSIAYISTAIDGTEQAFDGGASFKPRKVLLIAAHDCHRKADSTSRHSAALASNVPRVARLLGKIGLRGAGLAPHVSCASRFS